MKKTRPKDIDSLRRVHVIHKPAVPLKLYAKSVPLIRLHQALSLLRGEDCAGGSTEITRPKPIHVKPVAIRFGAADPFCAPAQE